MPRDGAGGYSLPIPAFVPGQIISASNENTNLGDIAAAITGSLARDGQGGMLGALAMGNNKITGLATPTLTTDATTKSYVDTADGLRVLKAGDTMTGALVLHADPTLALGAATKQYTDAAPSAKTSTANSFVTPGTDLPVGTGSAVNYLDITLPDGVADFIVSGWFYVQQTAAAANTAFVRIAQLDSGLGTLQSSDPIGLANVQGVALVAAPFVWAAASTNVNGSRLRFFGYKDAANGPFNLIRLQASVLMVAR